VDDVILDLDHRDVGLLAEHRRDPVRVRNDAARDADPRNVEDVRADVVDGERAANTLRLTPDAVEGLDP
jgi:hypothetical protein